MTNIKCKTDIEFKTEASLWAMMAELSPDGRSGKPFDMRRWDLSDDRIYRLSWGSANPFDRIYRLSWGSANPFTVDSTQLGEEANDGPWFPYETKVSFVNKTTGETITFEYKGVEFPRWAPGWGFLQLGHCLTAHKREES